MIFEICENIYGRCVYSWHTRKNRVVRYRNSSVNSTTNINILEVESHIFGCLQKPRSYEISSLKAKIKPHGDLMDHFRDYGPGYDPIYILPSLKVKLIEGNIENKSENLEIVLQKPFQEWL